MSCVTRHNLDDRDGSCRGELAYLEFREICYRGLDV